MYQCIFQTCLRLLPGVDLKPDPPPLPI
jgi:hypothetical protein